MRGQATGPSFVALTSRVAPWAYHQEIWSVAWIDHASLRLFRHQGFGYDPWSHSVEYPWEYCQPVTEIFSVIFLSPYL